MKNEKKENVQELTEKMLTDRFGEKWRQWQKDFAPRKLSIIEVEGKIVVLRPIGANEVSQFSMMVANPEIGLAKAAEYLLEELWIDGDKELISDEEYFISAMMQIQNAIELKKSSFYRI